MSDTRPITELVEWTSADDTPGRMITYRGNIKGVSEQPDATSCTVMIQNTVLNPDVNIPPWKYFVSVTGGIYSPLPSETTPSEDPEVQAQHTLGCDPRVGVAMASGTSKSGATYPCYNAFFYNLEAAIDWMKETIEIVLNTNSAHANEYRESRALMEQVLKIPAQLPIHENSG